MSFGMTVWAILTSSLLICTSLAYSDYADFETSNSGQFPLSHKSLNDWGELDEERNAYGTDTQRDLSGKFLELNSWPERDSATISRQLFGDKSAESSESLRSRGSEEAPKIKRESHSLSIVNPLDVLRQRLMLEMARRRMKENQDQIRENAVILKNLGKRAHESMGGEEAAEETRTNQDYLRRIHVSNSEDFSV